MRSGGRGGIIDRISTPSTPTTSESFLLGSMLAIQAFQLRFA
jgi:hypothetical protein